MSVLATVHRFHQTIPGLALAAGLELGLAFLLITLAIDSGSLWQYLLAMVLAIGGLQNAVLAVWRATHGQN